MFLINLCSGLKSILFINHCSDLRNDRKSTPGVSIKSVELFHQQEDERVRTKCSSTVCVGSAECVLVL